MPVQFGLAVENFTPAPRSPDLDRIRAYAATAERLGFRSLWVWDHLFLGSRTAFPFLESLTTLTALAAVTSSVRLGTGVLPLPLRNPVVLAKQAATLDHASGGRVTLGMAAGWYRREFEACGVPFNQRGRIFERNLEIVTRLWTEPQVTGTWDHLELRNVVMLPKPLQQPRPRILIGGYADRVLRRAATLGDGWLTYFYTADSFARAWERIRAHAEDAGRDPATLDSVAQLPICVADSFEEADRRARRFVADYFDIPEWSEATVDSTVRGTPEQCAEQLAAHVDAGVRQIVLMPEGYRTEQVELIAAEVLPKLAGLTATAPSTHG